MENLIQKWNKCFSHSRLPMLFVDNQFNILAVNEAFRERMGYELMELLAMNFIELFAQEDATNRLEQLIIEDRCYSFLIKLQYVNKTQEILSINTCINNFFSNDGTYEESLIVLSPTVYDYPFNLGLLDTIFNPANLN